MKVLLHLRDFLVENLKGLLVADRVGRRLDVEDLEDLEEVSLQDKAREVLIKAEKEQHWEFPLLLIPLAKDWLEEELPEHSLSEVRLPEVLEGAKSVEEVLSHLERESPFP